MQSFVFDLGVSQEGTSYMCLDNFANYQFVLAKPTFNSSLAMFLSCNTHATQHCQEYLRLLQQTSPWLRNSRVAQVNITSWRSHRGMYCVVCFFPLQDCTNCNVRNCMKIYEFMRWMTKLTAFTFTTFGEVLHPNASSRIPPVSFTVLSLDHLRRSCISEHDIFENGRSSCLVYQCIVFKDTVS